MQNRREQSSAKKQCAIFLGLILGCIFVGAGISYSRFSQPGAKADFQEGRESDFESKNPKFNRKSENSEQSDTGNDDASLTSEKSIFSEFSKKLNGLKEKIFHEDQIVISEEEIKKSVNFKGTEFNYIEKFF